MLRSFLRKSHFDIMICFRKIKYHSEIESHENSYISRSIINVIHEERRLKADYFEFGATDKFNESRQHNSTEIIL